MPVICQGYIGSVCLPGLNKVTINKSTGFLLSLDCGKICEGRRKPKRIGYCRLPACSV